ncbi:kinase [Colwellia sp. 1_MG-2023]|jgi:D-glycerate 3-kinase|uniref:kinase n=1 Tax=unclassified Colwellia TaxID=196834 RepID=UPI001C08FA02|nr:MULTISPECIES: kinase [unclassified Colwellia]MBU2923937.1 kinase [Colwellia sp. C2M11]MDO6488112.1 kinase [Colwellia sp. 6_MG-2023]MDO6653405.1 kinase [Colwellia sp. 3_MG-2023]MDO6666189.1 kinase [Colwellia sp. 2_MG-2023]MDO6690562.1 kinase [Colwellia sp. 1_MG-2023]
MLSTFLKEHKLPEEFKDTVKQYYKPLADRIFSKFNDAKQPYFVGINGCQGSGKSTLTDYIAEYLIDQYKVNVVVMSLDDFYYSSEKRNELARDIHPLLATRGVPGTHDVAALTKVISQLKAQETGFSIPKFDKATDEPFATDLWYSIEKPVDIILIEGWCWGVKSQTAEQLQKPINELELQHDADGVWRNYVNQQLKSLYEPLYKNMDFWLALQAPSFDCVYKWRLEQEQKLEARNQGLTNSKIMTPAEVLNFTQYFQRLSVQGCNSISHSADTIFHLSPDRSITEMHIIE